MRISLTFSLLPSTFAAFIEESIINGTFYAVFVVSSYFEFNFLFWKHISLCSFKYSTPRAVKPYVPSEWHIFISRLEYNHLLPNPFKLSISSWLPLQTSHNALPFRILVTQLFLMLLLQLIASDESDGGNRKWITKHLTVLSLHVVPSSKQSKISKLFRYPYQYPPWG